MPNPCGEVHMPNMPCRECDRARKLDEKPDIVKPAKPSRIARKSKAVGKNAAPVPNRADTNTPQRHCKGTAEISQKPKAERLGAAKQALNNAERQRRWREKDPEAYKAWNRERMRARRKK